MATTDLILQVSSQLPISGTPPIPGPSSPWTTVFDENSKANFSAVIDTNGMGALFQVFSLSGSDVVNIQQAVGPNAGDLFQNIVLKSTTVHLSTNQTLLFMPAPMRLRCNYVPGGATNLGAFWCYVTPVPLANFPAMSMFMP